MNGNNNKNNNNGAGVGKLKLIVTTIGFILGFVCLFVTIENDPKINQTLGLGIWIATLWLTEIIPLVVTAFLPMVLFPMFGILSSADVATSYINNTIFLLIAGFMVALALERWNLHRRFSLKVLTMCSNSPRSLLLGMMAATFFLSMFVSNTATSLMMAPNAVSVCDSLEKNSSSSSDDKTEDDGSNDTNDHDAQNNNKSDGNQTNTKKQQSKRFACALMLGIAYAANVGGMSSLIGCGPNLVVREQLALLFPDAPELTFAHWWAFALPVGLISFAIIWSYLCLVYLREWKSEVNDEEASSIFRKQYEALGDWSREQKAVCYLFASLCILWLFRTDLDFGSVQIKGWTNIFPEPSYISDGSAGMFIAIIMFIFPARSSMLACDEGQTTSSQKSYEDKLLVEEGSSSCTNDEDGTRDCHEDESFNKLDTTLLDWETANKMPYDIMFLMGGGFAVAKAFVEGGLSGYLGDQLAALNISTVWLVFLMTTLIIWLTELTSNTSTSNIMIPIAASLAVAAGTSPYSFMLPAALACTCAYALPIATPPNMVVFSSGRLPMSEMNKAGIFLNIISSFIILGATFSVIPAVFGVGATELPSWAESFAG